MSYKESDFSTVPRGKMGRRDPYFGVITHPKFRLADMNEQSRREFFGLCVAHVDYLMRNDSPYVDPAFVPKARLGLGCGVGRTSFHSPDCPAVVGVDVSVAMLEESRKNCEAHQADHSVLVSSDD